MNEKWKERVLALKRFHTTEEVNEYVSLVDEMRNNCTQDVAQVLMQTFTNHEDHGVQESVVSVLASADPEIYLVALLKELPRLINEAPEWATTLIAREAYYNPQLLVSVATTMQTHVKAILLQFLETDGMRELCPDVMMVARMLRKGA